MLKAVAFAIVLFAAFVAGGRAIAQQGQFQPPGTSTPRNQGQGGGGVLELPTLPGRQQGGSPSATIPPMAPQPGQELTVPPHELKSQEGYAQVTVTVTDQQGRYVTGLQKVKKEIKRKMI